MQSVSKKRANVKTARRIHEVDHLIALRLRLARVEAGLSQSELGSAVGVTFQQVQKYERALNRVTASSLLRMARVLNRDIGYFFTEVDDPAARLIVQGWEQNADRVRRLDVDIMRLLLRVDDLNLKLRIVDLLTERANLGNNSISRAR
ncbi:helix-turn-helix domain-containing protein [Ancylobacter sp.]|uniref:helix-turn-helix domain-containing protein n=1 Tax=Ancylobacter sp. TaxID=1872567 RepID=UPI003BAB80F3